VYKYRIIKEDAVLLLIDLQTRLMQALHEPEALYKNINIMIKAAGIFKIPIILTEQYPKGLGATVPEIMQNISDFHYIEKLKFSAYVPEFEEVIKKLNKKTMLVAGIEAHVCVYQTVRDLLAEGFKVHVLSDAVSSREIMNFKNALQLMHDVGAVISNTETVLFDMLGTAQTEEFKKISALVK